MKRGPTGYFVPISSTGETCRAFVPHPLPPNPVLKIDDEMQELHDKAMLAVGRLDGVTTLLPDPSIFLYSYIRKEAVLSSQIEGTQSSLSELLLFENQAAPGVPLDDVQEVSNYVAALNYGLKRLHEGFPLSLRLLKEIHAVLLEKGRGSDKEPGTFRHSQNWIGGTRPGNALFVPPPPDLLIEQMGALEKFLHDDPVKMPVLIKAALAHVQFETIHPFLDGNGRLGRLLITFLLCSENILEQPMLYLSLYLKTNRQKYYELLQSIRTEGDWETWLKFFLVGVEETARESVQTVRRLLKIFATDEKKIQEIGRAAGSSLRVHAYMCSQPIVSIKKTATTLKLSVPAVTTAMTQLQRLGIIRELTGNRYNRLFAYDQHLKILSEGTEPLK